MKKIIDDKDQKILALIPKLKDTFKSSEFIEAFKTAYPEDYEMLEQRFIHDERQTRSLDWKKNTIPTPEKYLVKAIKDFAKGHPTTLKHTAKGFKKPAKPAAGSSTPKTATKPVKPKPAVKTEPKKTTTKPKTTEKPAKSKTVAKAEPKKTATKPKSTEKPAKPKSAAKSDAKKPAAKKK
ncbi:MAG: hypothetical protein JW885_16710 [Deltaproteobacteria bacterium]|nr:hypothetical protein [Candidatus Zymogenaceae bacterium]